MVIRGVSTWLIGMQVMDVSMWVVGFTSNITVEVEVVVSIVLISMGVLVGMVIHWLHFKDKITGRCINI